MSEKRRDNNLSSVKEVSYCQDNCTIQENKFQQKEALQALFSEGQRICFQEGVNTPPIFCTFPFEASPEGTQFFVLNCFAEDAKKREGAAVLYRQGVTVEQDTISLELQREWFHAVLGHATVEVFSGGKSVHNHCVMNRPINNEESELIELLKKAYPFCDFGVLTDRARLCRIPGAVRDNGNLQTILYIGEKFDIQEVLKKLREKTAYINNVVTVTKSFLKALYPEGGKKTVFTPENIISGYDTVRDIKRGGEVSQTTAHTPGLHAAVVELLQSGYSLEPDTFEYRGLKENPLITPVLDQEIERARKEIEETVIKGAEERIKKIKNLPPKMKEGSWRWQTMNAMEGRWRTFYESQGIREIGDSKKVFGKIKIYDKKGIT